MKNKLKMILAYFRGFNKPRADIEFDMVDWEFNDDGLCMIDGKETNTNLTINNAIKPTSINLLNMLPKSCILSTFIINHNK